MAPSTQTIVYILAFCSAFLGLQIAIGAGKQAGVRLRLVNDRLRRLESDDPHTEVLRKIRKRRGLNTDGNLRLALLWLNKMVLHSGLPLGRYGALVWLLASTIIAGIAGYLWKGTPLWSVAGLIAGAIFPFLVLKFLVGRRRKRAVTQLPDALDIIVRSLQAGHPVPVALSLVGREMPDPIGSEFGIASDEISFGANTSGALQRLADRVGHADFELFSAMIRLQERTGGNLAELLRASADTIRERQKMRLKIKAASAEGRASALILNITPLGLYLAVNAMAPDFYGQVRDAPAMTYGLWGVICWMFLGNLIMRRMINFRI